MIVAFSLPLTLALIIMYLYPVARTVLMSFFKIESVTSSMSAWSFYGVGNYAKIFSSATFQGSMKNMGLIWLVGGIITLFFSIPNLYKQDIHFLRNDTIHQEFSISNSRIDLKNVNLMNNGGKDTLVVKDKKIIIAK